MPSLFFGGGLNEQDDFHVNEQECIEGQNFVLDSQAKTFNPRPPSDLKTTAVNEGAVTGILQLVKRDNTETTLVVAGDTIYTYASPTSTSTVRAPITTGSRLRDVYWSLDDFLVVTDLDLNEKISKWDGTTYSRLGTNIPTGSPTAITGQITRSASVATVTQSGHGYSNEDLIIVAGADQTEYNGEFEISAVTTDSFQYTVTGTPATPATGSITFDLGQSVKAKYAVVHLGRVWLFNVDIEGTAFPHVVLVSKFEDPTDYDSGTRNLAGGLTASDPFFMHSPDLKPINGVAKFFDRIVISTENGRLFRLTGADSTDFDWKEFYPGSSALPGESLVNIGNDVAYIRQGGNIDLLGATEQFGDVSADDISRFIPTQASGITSAISVYDQQNQRVLFFTGDQILVFDKDAFLRNGGLSPWSVWKTLLTGGYTSSAARYLQSPGASTFSVYWGDASGNVYDLNGTGTTGDGGSTNINTFRKTKLITELPSIDKRLIGRVFYKRRTALTLDMEFDWAEEYNKFTCEVPLKATFDSTESFEFWGGFYWGGGHWGGEFQTTKQISTVGFSAIGRGPGFFLKLATTTTGDFLVSQIEIA